MFQPEPLAACRTGSALRVLLIQTQAETRSISLMVSQEKQPIGGKEMSDCDLRVGGGNRSYSYGFSPSSMMVC